MIDCPLRLTATGALFLLMAPRFRKLGSPIATISRQPLGGADPASPSTWGPARSTEALKISQADAIELGLSG